MPEGVVVKQRRLLAPRITEVSGVDRPAHMRDGFIIKKSVDSAGTAALLAALGRGALMPKAVEAATASALLKSLDADQRKLLVEDGGTVALAKALTPEQTAEFQKAADASDLQPLLDQLAQVWSDLRALSEKEDETVPSTEVDPATGVAPVTPAAPDAAAVLASPALAKALGDDAVAMLKALHDRAEAAERIAAEAVQKSLDEKAVTDFEKAYAGLDLDASVAAPALRALETANPDAAAAVRKALDSAKATTDANRSILVKEIGRVPTPTAGSPEAEVQTIAKSLVDSGEAKTIEQGVLLAYQRNPKLYDAARGAGEE